MITEGIIVEINYNTNKCKIRLPLFENTSSQNKVILEARIAILPGYFNNYKANDLVWIGFVDNKINKPLIIGKIYKNADEEIQNSGGTLRVTSLDVTGQSASIPLLTEISNAPNSYSNINKLIAKLSENSIRLDNISPIIDYLLDSTRRVFIINSFNDAGIDNTIQEDKTYKVKENTDKIIFDYCSTTGTSGEVYLKDILKTDIFLNNNRDEPDLWVKDNRYYNAILIKFMPFSYLKKAPESGTNVEANVENETSKILLKNLKVDGILYSIPNNVIANVADEATQNLSKIKIGNIVYNVTGSGSKEIYYGKNEPSELDKTEFWFKEI